MRGVRRFVDDLLAGRRPRGFRARPTDVETLRTAIRLSAARPGEGTPDDEFVARLHDRLASRHDGTTDPRPAPTAAGTRRRFVLVTSVAAGAAAVGAGLDRLWAFGRPSTRVEPTATGPLRPNAGVWWTVTQSVDLPEGGIRGFDLGSVTGFVERSGGRVRAVSGVCTHQGCHLALDPAVRRLNCPCHRTVFAMTGDVFRSQLRPSPPKLPELEVREADGLVQVYAPPKAV